MIIITSVINQQLHLHKFHIKTLKTLKITPTCFDLFQIIVRELCFSSLKLYYNIRNLIRFCKHGVVAACHVKWEYAVESAAGQVCVICYVMRDWLSQSLITQRRERAVGWVCVICYVMRDWLSQSLITQRRESSWLGVRRMLRNEGLTEPVPHYVAQREREQLAGCALYAT